MHIGRTLMGKFNEHSYRKLERRCFEENFWTPEPVTFLRSEAPEFHFLDIIGNDVLCVPDFVHQKRKNPPINSHINFFLMINDWHTRL